jgi:hypothetical protein
VTEFNMQIQNVAIFADIAPETVLIWIERKYGKLSDFIKEFQELKPKQLELVGAIIGDRTIFEHKKMLRQMVLPLMQNLRCKNEYNS